MMTVFSVGIAWPHKLEVPPEVVMSMLPVLKGLRGAGRSGTSCVLVMCSLSCVICCRADSVLALQRLQGKTR